MYLKHIEIQGFKSFPDKTKVVFEPGLTAIVGPNGSGKSNISDAIRWVLGEQSTKSLRGGKMEDVIFGGTQLRKAMGFAQVSLVLDNTDERFTDMGAEIAIGRRYYRSGDSEYLINGAPVRLRDLRETFMDTGLGRDGYSIIEQGRISEVVSAKPVDRREIFEEASGIAKYRYRKNEAQRKLDAAEDNLSRLRDILEELESRIGPLKKQSEDAKVFLELSAQKKSLEITLYCDTIERTKTNLKTQDEKLEIAKNDYANIENKITELDEKIEKSFVQNSELMGQIDELNSEIIETSEQISAIESAVAVVKNDIEHGREQVEALKRDRESASETGGGLSQDIEQRLALVAGVESEIATLDEEIATLEQRLSDLALEGEQSEGRRGEIAAQLAALSSEATDLRVSSVSAKSTAETLAERAESVTGSMPELESNLEQAKQVKDELDIELKELEKDVASSQNQLGGFEKKRDARKQSLAALDEQYANQDAEHRQLATRIRTLEDMEKSMEGFMPSVKRVVERARAGELRGVTGTVASLISIQNGCEIAIETALGAAMQNIIVADERAAKAAIAYLKDNKAGRATFLPLDTLKPRAFDDKNGLSMGGVVGLASELVGCDEKYRPAIDWLLGRTVVADDINTASAAAKQMRYRFKVVTLDGQVINAGGSYTGGYLARSAGVFSRKNEIDRLEVKRKDAEKKLAQLKQERDKAQTELTSIEANITVLSSELVNLGGDKIRAETEQKRLGVELDHAAQALNQASLELETAEATRSRLLEQAKADEEKLAQVQKEIAALEQSAGDVSSSGDEFNRRRAELADALSAGKLLRLEKQKDKETVEAIVEQLKQRGESESSRTSDIDKAIETIEQLNESRLAEIELKQLQAEQLRQKIEESRAKIAESGAQRTDIEKETNLARENQGNLTREREDIAREISRLEERKVSLQGEYDNATAKLWEDYELTVAEAGQLCVPYETITALRGEVSSLRAKIRALGSVNVAAIDEYKEVGERYEFLTAQVDDVTKSKAELIALIDRLMGEMKQIFVGNFERINSHFRRAFIELFGGGSANLSLTDESDVLESGIEINVQPPGKVIKNLSALSGGEQSLVAIALYFAIMAVNPSPFCVLDEIDSALDDANVVRYASYLRRMSADTQLITITHRRGTMEAAEILYGVTMQEEGVSKLLRMTQDEAVLVVDSR